ncbi:MAG: hypothetical protein DMD94_02295 [Candidatus Rokuibacteriota bacterium]|nr:MAG: hypothetical protein DMD94_02295 [Candidatus Rokubacteria bacterium]
MNSANVAVFAVLAALMTPLPSADYAHGAAPQAQYVLAMSKDDKICKPLLAVYNRNISLDLGPKSQPYPYPWPAPSQVSLKWTTKKWQGLAHDQRVLEKAYTVAEADVDGDGRMNIVVRLAAWLRSDDRFTSLTVFPGGTVLPDQMDQYKRFEPQQAVATVVAGGYDLPKLNRRVQPTALNDFDVIRFGGREFVTGKTVEMDGIVELKNVPRWRVVSRVRIAASPNRPEPDLDKVLDSVCYFQLKASPSKG